VRGFWHPTIPEKEPGRKLPTAARAEWMAGKSQLDLSRLVFIDEAGAKTNMTRL
jgi:hypothetical protein